MFRKKTNAFPVSGGSVKRRWQPSMRLLRLLHLFWEQSGIKVWYPDFDRESAIRAGSAGGLMKGSHAYVSDGCGCSLRFRWGCLLVFPR